MSNNTTQNLANYDTPQNVGEHPHDKTGTIEEIKIIKVNPVTIINTQTEKTWPGLRVQKKNRCGVCKKKALVVSVQTPPHFVVFIDYPKTTSAPTITEVTRWVIYLISWLGL